MTRKLSIRGRPEGRPPVPIDWEEFDKLCGLHCTLTEIASWFGCSVDTIENRVKQEKGLGFSEYWAEKAEKGKIAIRRAQMQQALKGDRVLLIWLGKQLLGQRDQLDHQITGSVGGPVRVDLSKLTDEELEELDRIQQKIAVPAIASASATVTTPKPN
jgi:hypothetical protein